VEGGHLEKLDTVEGVDVDKAALDGVGLAAVGGTLAVLAEGGDQAGGEAVAADVGRLAGAGGDAAEAGSDLSGEGRGGHGNGQDGEEAGELHFESCVGVALKKADGAFV
jgi:hypothetical protein